MRSHLRSPDEMNWSNTTCAPLAKSPNCASHKRQRVGLGQRIAVLEAEHRLFRQHRVDDLEARLLVGEVVERRVAVLVLLVDQHRMALARTCRARCPGRRAAPDGLRAAASRTPAPRRSPSRCPAPVSIAFARASRKRWMVRWTWKPSGTLVILLPMSFERLDRDAGVAAARIVAQPRAAFMPAQRPSSQSALLAL